MPNYRNITTGDTTTLDDEILTFEEANVQKPKWIKLTPAMVGVTMYRYCVHLRRPLSEK